MCLSLMEAQILNLCAAPLPKSVMLKTSWPSMGKGVVYIVRQRGLLGCSHGNSCRDFPRLIFLPPGILGRLQASWCQLIFVLMGTATQLSEALWHGVHGKAIGVRCSWRNWGSQVWGGSGTAVFPTA